MSFVKNRPWIILIVLGLLTYWPLVNSGFVGDDHVQIRLNSAIHSLNNPLSFFKGSTFHSGGAETMQGTYYKPVMSLTFATIYHFFGANPFYFHLLLILLAIANSLLVFLLLKNFLNPIWTLIGSVLFLIHPMNSEVVQYLSNFQDALFMFFGMSALNLEISRKTTRSLAVVILLLLLSYLSKETGLVFSALVLMYHLLYKRESSAKILIIALSLSWVIYLFLRIGVAQMLSLQAQYTPMETAPLGVRLLNLPAVFFYYIKTAIFPWPLSIGQNWIHAEISFFNFIIPLAGLLIFFALSKLTVQKFENPARLFLSFFLFSILIHLHFVPLDATVADRWFYLPSIGLIGLVLLWCQSIQNQKRAIGCISVAIIIFGALTISRNQDWMDEEKLLSRDLKYQPDSFALMNQLGKLYFDQNRIEESCDLFQRSVAIAPRWWVNTNNLGACLYKQGLSEEAKVYFLKSIQNGHYYLAYENYAKVLIREKRFQEAQEFITQQALPRFPNNPVFPALLTEIAKAQ